MKLGAPERPLSKRQRDTLIALLRSTWMGGAPSHSELAEHLGFWGASDVSRVVFDLERKGLVERPYRSRVRLTSEGVRVGLEHVCDDGLAFLAEEVGGRLAALRVEVERRAGSPALLPTGRNE